MGHGIPKTPTIEQQQLMKHKFKFVPKIILKKSQKEERFRESEDSQGFFY